MYFPRVDVFLDGNHPRPQRHHLGAIDPGGCIRAKKSGGGIKAMPAEGGSCRSFAGGTLGTSRFIGSFASTYITLP
jgi:hypothetical protein